MAGLVDDIRYGVRGLVKSPGVSLISILMLALGIGANTAIFSVVNAALLRPLAFKEPEQLMMVFSRTPGEPRSSVSYSDLLDWRQQSHSFSKLSAVTPQSVNITGRSEPGRLLGGFVSSEFFKTLGVESALGRTFVNGEDTAVAERVAVLNHIVWRDRFGSDPAIIGQALTINGQAFTVVGIMPEGFRFPYSDIEVWLPVQFLPSFVATRKVRTIEVLGRLKPGVTASQAQTEMDAIAARLAQQYPETNGSRGIKLVSLQSMVVERVRPLLMILLGAVGLILLIACANVGNLMLSRAVGRSRELALRAALGASRFRLIRQLMTESLILSLAGGLGGLLVGLWGMDALATNSGVTLPFGVTVRLDPVVFGYAVGLTALAGILFGLLPAVRFSHPDLNDTLKEGGRSATAHRTQNRLRRALLVTQVVLATILLAGAGLLIRSFVNYLHVDPGFDPTNLLTLEYRIPRDKYSTARQQQDFHEAVVKRVQQVPGVEGVGLVMSVPHGAGIGVSAVTRPDRAMPPEGQELRAFINRTDGNYFRAMKIPLVRGRVFDSQDQANTPLSVVINVSMAERLWPNEDPVGRPVHLLNPDVDCVVIGVVGNTKHQSLDEPEMSQMYLAYSQRADIFASLVVRTSGEPMGLANAVRSAIWEVDKDQPIWKVRSMEFLLARSIGGHRFLVQLLGIFSVLATILAAVGIYGVMSYSVSQRTNEIGIRMALGAQPADVLRMVIGQGMRLTLVGVLLGVVASLVLTRVIGFQLFGVSPVDPVTFGGIAMILLAVALLACYLPARRATRVDPMTALQT